MYLDILYSMWYEYQKQNIKNTIELDYESLSVHPMWVKKEHRKEFIFDGKVYPTGLTDAKIAKMEKEKEEAVKKILPQQNAETT